ncbi:Dihydropteroate synthase [Halothece sp. PCC 7418]|uniref:dihydropteroate synthase n=1 Tax=Halothece sp. (strain PCC 7418) TaxID=65093 RepID=UPI0002A0637A|nr:dihydropteroate synthase [Halothece sp. PCC 7418]AFZ44339.1 Dihydropteroate synthase [Halothece sp. PCC 7418]
MKQEALVIRNKSFLWGEQTYLMGVLNITPDSFSDGGDYNNLEEAFQRAAALVEAGADILDVGGQSTRPGAKQISPEEELERVIPIIKRIRKHLNIPISVDTTRAEIAQQAVRAGADIVNDISGGTFDADMLTTVAALEVPIILMHIRGTPETMQQMTDYEDLVGEIMGVLQERLSAAEAAGIARSRLLIDPGIGFGKTAEQNLELLRKLDQFQSLGVPILVGTSRKSFIGKIINQDDPKQRVWGTASSCCAAIAQGADLLRVHDLPQMWEVSQVADAIWRV